MARPSEGHQRDPVDPDDRRTVARPARGVWAVHHGSWAIHALVEGRDLGATPARAPSAARRQRQAGPRALVHRREQRSREPCGSNGRKKGGPNEPRDHALGRSRGGFGSKIHLVCDRDGVPLAVDVSPGQRHESKWFERTMDSVRSPNGRGLAIRRPKRLGGDRGYSYPAIRRWLHRHRIDAVIPTRIDQPRQEAFDRVAYRGRNIVERCVGWLKEARRVATRFEQLAETFLGMLRLAIIRRLLRVIASSGRRLRVG